jgi:PhnB protein
VVKRNIGNGRTHHAEVIAERLTCLHKIESMTAPTPYVHLPGTARDALNFYGDVFGCEVELHTLQEFNRTDGPAGAIAHGSLLGGPVSLFAADVTGDEPPFCCHGMMLSLLGAAAPATLRTWFTKLSEGGRIVDDLQTRPWGASDGQVIDRYGLHWLIGFEGDEND